MAGVMHHHSERGWSELRPHADVCRDVILLSILLKGLLGCHCARHTRRGNPDNPVCRRAVIRAAWSIQNTWMASPADNIFMLCRLLCRNPLRRAT